MSPARAIAALPPLSVREVAEELGWDIRELRARLWYLHGMNGERLLYRESEAPNAKLWVDRDELARLWATRFGPGAHRLSEDDRIKAAEDLARQALRELADLRRDAARDGESRQQSRKK